MSSTSPAPDRLGTVVRAEAGDTGSGSLVFIYAAFLLLCTLPTSASFDSPRIVNPYTNTSPLGNFVCEIDPTDIYGRGDARYRLLRNGSVIWEGLKHFTLVQSAVTDEGFIAGLVSDLAPRLQH